MIRSLILLVALITLTFLLEAQDCQESFLIQRIDGSGTGNYFLKISDAERNRLLEAQTNSSIYKGPVNYCAEGAPFQIHVQDPSRLPDGEFLIVVEQGDPEEFLLKYELYLDGNFISDKTIANPFASPGAAYVEMFPQFGFQLDIKIPSEAGDETEEERNGVIGQEITFEDDNQWLKMLGDKTQFGTTELDFLDTEFGDEFFELDPYQAFSNFGLANFGPFSLCKVGGIMETK